jgi:hypothetical protein
LRWGRRACCEEIIAELPDLTREDVREALLYAAEAAPTPGSALGRTARRKPGHPYGHIDQGGSQGSMPCAARSRLAAPADLAQFARFAPV